MSKKPEEQDTFDQVIKAIDDTETAPERHLSLQMDKAVRDAILAARESGQKASVTLQLKVQPGPERRVSFVANLKTSLPRPPVSTVTLYADEEAGLHRSDPAQSKLPFPAPVPLHPNQKQ